MKNIKSFKYFKEDFNWDDYGQKRKIVTDIIAINSMEKHRKLIFKLN